MRLFVIIVLILNAIHCPIPFPDLDGECRGVPIVSLTDANAWHVLMLGVVPNDDIDNGPVRTGDDRPLDNARPSAFDELDAVVQTRSNDATHVVSCTSHASQAFLFFAPELSSHFRYAAGCQQSRPVCLEGSTASPRCDVLRV